MRPGAFVLGLLVASAGLYAQAPPTAPAPYAPNASASPAVAPAPYVANASASPAPNTAEVLDRLARLVKDGRLKVETDLIEGSVPAIPKYALEVRGAPKTTVEIDAVDGRVTHMLFSVGDGGKLVVRGSGLRPRVSIEKLEFQEPEGFTEMKLHGLGIWKPIVAIFGGIARSAVRKLELHTDIPSVMRGEILGGKKATPPPTPTPPPGGVPPPSFLDLVREVRIDEMVVTAYSGRRMFLRPFVAFDTASDPASGEAMKVSLEKGVFRPGRDGAPNFVEFSGHLDGEIENGEMEFQNNRCEIARGNIRGAAFEAKTREDGKLATALSADNLFFELSSGNFVVPGGMAVALDQGSTFDVSAVKVTSDGHFSGVAKLDLAGQTGELSRKGATISAAGIKLTTAGLTIVDGHATGPLDISFDYRLEYPFVVNYPIEEVPEKTVLLDFHGPFAASLALKDAGGEDGEVTGTYVFKSPWDPIEQAALVALAAKWRQDLAVKNIDFTITPKTFRPCGETCFTLAIEITAEKRSQNRLKRLFSQYCAPVASASLVIDKPLRAFLLRDIKVQTHCKGAVGWVINFIAPLLTKTYTDLKLFQMPEDMPLTIDSVRGGAKVVEIGGTVDWQAGQAKPAVPPEPQPVVVEPSR